MNSLRKTKPLKLLRKTIELEQYDRLDKLKKMDVYLSRCKKNILVLEDYIKQYDAPLLSQRPTEPHQIINHLSFLHQLSEKLVHQNHSHQTLLSQKKALLNDIGNARQKLVVIDETIGRIEHTLELEQNNLQARFELEEWITNQYALINGGKE